MILIFNNINPLTACSACMSVKLIKKRKRDLLRMKESKNQPKKYERESGIIRDKVSRKWLKVRVKKSKRVERIKCMKKLIRKKSVGSI